MVHLKETSKNAFEDQRQSFFGGVRDVEDVEVAHETGCQARTTTSRGSCSAHHRKLLNLFEELLRSVVEATLVKQLSQQFNGRLRAKDFNRWHVDVINKNESL